jgi:hypothetical protein
MGTQLQPGQQVTVNAFGGKRPSVIVVEDRGDVVLVCKPSEFQQAKLENRHPLAVGFHREDVIEQVKNERKGVSSERPMDTRRDSMAGDKMKSGEMTEGRKLLGDSTL